MTGDDETAAPESETVERRLARRPGGTPPLSPDQRTVFDAHFADDAVVAAAAGSGTGKTTTAVEVVAEAVVRELGRHPERNPFESVLVTTFTRDAARQLKTELKERLREHRDAAPPGDPVVERWDDVLRWIETASHVRTLDSFTQELLREVAPEVGVSPSFSVADGLRRADLLEEVFEAVRSDPDLGDAVERLARAFPAERPADGRGPRGDWRSMVASMHRSCREFGRSMETARRELLQSVTAMHAGREPETFEDVLATVDDLTDYDPEHARATMRDPERWVAYARETYRTSRRLAGDFGRVLTAFDREYDRRSRTRGVLTHTDITHIVREFLAGDGDAATAGRRERFRESLSARFRHVVVDEFQDTNYAQCRVLSHLVGERTLLIGDLKQSVYEWRSAEPRLFAELLDYATGDAAGNVLDAERVRRVDLAENFRSHPHLVRAANHLFPRIFDDPGRGDIGTFDVEYDPLEPRRPETDPDRAHVHALDVDPPDEDEGEKEDDRSRRARVVEREAERVAGLLRTALDEGQLRVDRNPGTGTTGGDDAAFVSDAGETDPVRAGDVAVLFRSRRYMRLYSRVLDRYGVENAVIGTRSLFRRPEVSVLVDALVWLERPTDPGRTRRVVESALVGLSVDGRERMAAHGHDLDRALSAWDGDERDRRELADLRALRDELRHVRDGPKGNLVVDLLTHSAFDVTALATEDGLERYANVRRFVEVIADWEDDDRLPYGEFVRRLEGLRSGRVEDDTAPAAVADMDSPDTVKLLTAHAAKGLEFPVVVLADTTRDEAYQRVCDEPFVADRRHGLALRPVAGGDPPPGELPTFRGGWYHDGDAGFARDRGILWLAEVRGRDGRLRHDHPFTPHVRDRRAEFWRLLYVAVTRASDHLVVPFVPTRGGEWTTWAAALADHLTPGEDGCVETASGPLPVGVDDIDDADPPETETVTLPDLLDPVAEGGVGGSETGDGTDGSIGDRSFRPASLASAEAGALDDPPALQRLLRGVTDSLGLAPLDRTVAATTPTAGRATGSDVSGDRLETLLRRAMTAVHREGSLDTPGAVVDRVVEEEAQKGATVTEWTRAWLRDCVTAYRQTELEEAVTGADRVVADVGAATPVADRDDPSGDWPTLLRGTADVVYSNENDDGWRAALFRLSSGDGAESGGGGGAERERVERADAAAVAAALDGVGVDVTGVTVCRLPDGRCRTVTPPDDPATALRGLTDLVVDDEGVLRRASDG